MKIEPGSPGKIQVDCMTCGGMFEIDDYRREIFADITEKCLNKYRYCPHCEAELLAVRKQQQAHEQESARIAEFRANFVSCTAAAGIPYNYVHDRFSGKPFKEPPERFAAEWIWQHRTCNILVSGVTGSGKSTSLCFVAAKLLESGKKVRYYQLGHLLSLWRTARRSDDPEADTKFLSRLFKMNDITIIDEVIGKARISESGQELLFDILEAVNNGECRSRIYLAGNFYSGSIEDIFADPEPTRRRLAENFVAVRLDAKAKKCIPLELWSHR